MRKLFLTMILLLDMAFPAAAADEALVLSLFEGTPQAENISAASGTEDSAQSGIFSFLNFDNLKEKINVFGNKNAQNVPASLEQTLQAAKKGDLNAQLLLGYTFLYGQNGVPVDYDKAFYFYALAALQNDSIGLNNLGSLYYSGIGVKRNSAKAAILFEKAADLGNAEAAVNLGFMLISGNGIKKNPTLAMQYFEQAAKAQNPTAQFMLGYAYYTGKLKPHDYALAAPLIKSAAAAGFDEAQYTLALMYVNGYGFPQNYGNAVKNLKYAAAQGSIEAMQVLADILSRGEKYNRDIPTAHVMYNLAATRGVAKAAKRRSELEAKMKIEEVLQARTRERFEPICPPDVRHQYSLIHRQF